MMRKIEFGTLVALGSAGLALRPPPVPRAETLATFDPEIFATSRGRGRRGDGFGVQFV